VKRSRIIALVPASLVGLLVLAVFGYGNTPPPGITPAVVGSTLACYPSPVFPDDIIAEDFNSDGWPDLAVSGFGDSTIWLYENQGAIANLPGVFVPNSGTLGGPISVPLGPVALVSGQLGLIAERSSGSFEKGDQIPGFDGYPDLGILSGVSAQLSGVNFTAKPLGNIARLSINGIWGSGSPLPASPVHMAIGDFDRTDALSDIVVLSAGTPAVGAPPALRFYTSAAYRAAYAADPPTPIIPIKIDLPNFAPSYVTVADFNQDGWDDVAVCDVSNTVTIYYLNNVVVIGTFPISLGGVSPTAMDVADFNHDGFPDIVAVGNINGSGFAVILQNNVSLPERFVALPAQPTWGLNATYVEAFDADGNGWPDFAVANYDSNTITIFLNQPERATSVQRKTRDTVCVSPKAVNIEIKPIFKYELECGYYPTAIASGDFDRNGKMDMAISLYSSTEEISPQVPSCIEVIFDVSCGTQPDQELHRIEPQSEPQECECCSENTPPTPEIQTGSDSKNP